METWTSREHFPARTQLKLRDVWEQGFLFSGAMGISRQRTLEREQGRILLKLQIHVWIGWNVVS